MHQQRLPPGRPPARPAPQIHGRFHVDERQRHEFGQPAGALLEIADVEEMRGPGLRPLDVPEHDGGGGAQAYPVRGLDHFEPFAGVELVRTDALAHLVVEDLGRRAGEAAETLRAQPLQKRAQGHAERLRAVRDFERREGVHVHSRHRLLHGAQQGQIGVAGVGRMNAALQADLGGAAVPGLDRAPGDLVQREVVGPAAQIIAQLSFRECAEAASIAADVGVIDVAIDHVADDVAAGPGAQRVGGGADLLDLRTARREQADDVVRFEPLASGRTIKQPYKTAKFGRERAAVCSLSPQGRGMG